MPQTDRMPTMAKMFAAACLAAVAWVGSEMFRPLMPPDTAFGWFNEVNVVLGLLCGWVVTGSRVGNGISEAIGAGLTGVAALIFWALFVHSFNEMLGRALDRRYEGPVEALVSVFELGVEYGAYMLNGPFIGFLVAGGIVTGLVAEWVSHRWS
ncbi:hypothetical protein PEL8287_03320 [Roseovarius litorisediminis]|uniref:Tellurium resistance protein n=1 Tax=Roseovarius litorisediminis TaxID=1312363 RepID=A0A1Y5TD30_9RHOB|nr:TrgA family protein [Roseovarius litorisediminis]SLN61359.1 hypothetical protein PEL8287_03320 [Roseovarius litorisediminis]